MFEVGDIIECLDASSCGGRLCVGSRYIVYALANSITTIKYVSVADLLTLRPLIISEYDRDYPCLFAPYRFRKVIHE